MPTHRPRPPTRRSPNRHPHRHPPRTRKSRKSRKSPTPYPPETRSIWTNWKQRTITYPKRPTHLKLSQLDRIPYVNEHHQPITLDNEREEQYVSHDCIAPESTVLELGGRYGVVSAVINHKLERPTRHVVVEPDPSVMDCLRINKTSHRCHFRIVNGIVSRRPQYFLPKGYASQTHATPSTKASVPVPTYTVEDLQRKYHLTFDTLVADCEGCLCDFVKENTALVTQQLKSIMFEADLPKRCDYGWIRGVLRKAGFTEVIRGFVSFWKKA